MTSNNDILEALTNIYGSPNVSGEERRKAYYLVDDTVDEVIRGINAVNKDINTATDLYAVHYEDKTLLQIDI